jgi:hypothetical protein
MEKVKRHVGRPKRLTHEQLRQMPEAILLERRVDGNYASELNRLLGIKRKPVGGLENRIPQKGSKGKLKRQTFTYPGG